jgi:4-hydroxy-3-polyprenylbenzoate decarboxylase
MTKQGERIETQVSAEVIDLRSAIDLLSSVPGQLLKITEPVDPKDELAGIYKPIGAGTPTKPPTRSGPAALFERVKGYNIPVITGVLANRERVALLLPILINIGLDP